MAAPASRAASSSPPNAVFAPSCAASTAAPATGSPSGKNAANGVGSGEKLLVS